MKAAICDAVYALKCLPQLRLQFQHSICYISIIKNLTLPDIGEEHYIPLTLFILKHPESFAQNHCNIGAELIFCLLQCCVGGD